MMELLKYLNARLGEASTWAAFAGLLSAAHVHVDPGFWQSVTLYGVIGSGAIAVLLREMGTKPSDAVAADVVAAFLDGIKVGVPPQPPSVPPAS